MMNEPFPECPFCRSNHLLKSDILAETDRAYLTNSVRFPGKYLIIPTTHIESLTDLSDTWWQDVKGLLAKTPENLSEYNLSFNVGRQAGQTVKHVHLWVIPRHENEPNAGKGLVSLLGIQPAD